MEEEVKVFIHRNDEYKYHLEPNFESLQSLEGFERLESLNNFQWHNKLIDHLVRSIWLEYWFDHPRKKLQDMKPKK